MITFAEIAIGGGGDVACARCAEDVSPTFRDADDVLADVRTVAANWFAAPGPNVSFVGAEPFAHSDLPVMVTGASRLGVERIRLRTDAAALSLPENAEGALHAGVRHVEVILIGGSAPVHDSLSREDGSFEATMEGLRAFRSAAADHGATVAITGLVPVCRHNLEHLPDAVAALARAGAVAVALDIAPAAEASVNAGKWLMAAAETGTVNAVWVHVRGKPARGALVSRLHTVAPAESVAVLS